MCPRGVLLVCALVGASAACDEAAPFASPKKPDAGEPDGEAGPGSGGGGGGSYRVGNGGGDNTGSGRDAAAEATGDGGGASSDDAGADGAPEDAGGGGPSCARPAGPYEVRLPGGASNDLNFCTPADGKVFDWGTWFECPAASETYSATGCSVEQQFACGDAGITTLQCQLLDAEGKALDCRLKLGSGCASGVVRLDSVVCPTSLTLPDGFCCAPGEEWTGGKCQ